MKTQPQRVILRTEPSLVGAALGAWLARQPGFEVVLETEHDVVATACERDVVVVSAPIESEATVFVLSSNHVSIIRSGSLESYPYRDLEQLCALIKKPNPVDSYRATFFPEGGAMDEHAV